MAGNLARPRLSKNHQNWQLSYELPHRIYTAKAYPLKSPNDSKIIIYGHENGVKIIWRGGRPFQQTEEAPAPAARANGAEKAIVLLDSDDEDAAGAKFEDKPTFAADEEQLDPSRPYPPILQDLDLYLGTDVLHIALLPASVLKADNTFQHGLEILKQKIIFAVSCSDNTTRLITLPATPPSPASKTRKEFRSNPTSANAGNGSWGETVATLVGHRKSSDGVTITVESPASTEKRETKPAKAHIIVASHSREVRGSLLLWRIPSSSLNSQLEPFQNLHLVSPAKSIHFSPSLSAHHSSQLLVAEAAGPCRIYDYKIISRTSSGEPNTQPIEQGTWLLSLYPGFQNQKNDAALGARAGFGRKQVVDAQWVANGNAILLLLNDGEFGIWDIEGVGPGASQGLLGRQGVTGASISPFSIGGYLDIGLRTKASSQPQPSTSKGFAPMTPGTRKSTTPFVERGTNTTIRGQISISEVPTAPSSNLSNETIFLWLGDSFAVISNLAKFWASNLRKGGSGNLFTGDAGSGSRIVKLDGVDLKGERCCGIELIGKATQSINELPAEMLILGDHRFTILNTSQYQQRRSQPASSRAGLVGRSENTDAQVTTGDLDILGIDQALTRMENGRSKKLFGS